MRSSFLSFSPPFLDEGEVAEVVDTLRSDWITTGPKVRRFEQSFAEFVGAPAALAVASCTDALQVALATLGVGPGHAVVSTPMTFCSSIHVIEHVGARPVLADVEPETLTLDPERVAEAVERANREGTPVRALLPVHLYGHPCDLDALGAIARDYHLDVVEDAAHALPTRYQGDLVGSSALASRIARGSDVRVLTAFSFYATKNLTTAEGGMLTGHPDLVADARIWSLHGMTRDAYKRYSAEGSWFYEVVRPGFKCNMTDVQASIGIHQLQKLPAFQRRRREVADRYTAAFASLPELQVPVELPEAEHAWHIYPLRLNLETLSIDRARFIEELKARNIGTSVHFIPIHLHPYYRDKYGYTPEDFPIAYREYQRLVSLPIYPRMSDQDIDDVIEAVADVVQRYRR